jgi:two-component system response regulator AtoC
LAESGRSAIEMAKHANYDIMFMDVVMPEIDGFQAFEEIKQIDPRIKVILMTGHNIEGFVERGIAQGAFACVSKTDDMGDLLKITVKALKLKGKE